MNDSTKENAVPAGVNEDEEFTAAAPEAKAEPIEDEVAAAAEAKEEAEAEAKKKAAAKAAKVTKAKAKAKAKDDEEDGESGPAKRKLDRSRDFGTIRGVLASGARFMQDGYSFDIHGDHLEDVPREDVPDPIKPSKERPAHVKQVKTDTTFAGVDLALWASGEELYPWMEVQNAVKSATGKTPGTKDQAMELVRNHGITVDPEAIQEEE